MGLGSQRSNGQPPLQAINFGQREYTSLIKAAKVQPITFHGLRHYAECRVMPSSACFRGFLAVI